ncbi:glycosyl hydrolase family 18 protein [Bacillus fonticola]|uniref:glycosyl hydrolase family 18 protein n=1 Tax=Bacillus fonticola TaxID=2728853 RepID=UPI001472953E|nr:glycosyl hydrolase family 18 protein [Bacillus fonticola]
MQIHTVQRGQTLFGIAQAYSITVNELVEANGIAPEETLVVGLALVIPIYGQFYWVQPGDSLYSIGRKFSVSFEELAAVNELNVSQPITIGLRLYIPEQSKPEKEYLGYEYAPIETSSLQRELPYLSYLALFSYEFTEDGDLRTPALGEIYEAAVTSRAALSMVTTNIKNGQFDSELVSDLLSNATKRGQLLAQIEAEAERVGYRDIHFDFEYVPKDSADDYELFLREAKVMCTRNGWFLSTAITPKTSSDQTGLLYEGIDYSVHGEICDFVVLMSYGWGWSGGPPLPISPLPLVREVLEYALSQIPASKILLGQNLYGYDWTLPYAENRPAQSVSPQESIDIARRYNRPIRYDYRDQAPYIDYIDENAKEHRVWFEDARSSQAKFELVKEYNLRGVGAWQIAFDFPQNWLILADTFTIKSKNPPNR